MAAALSGAIVSQLRHWRNNRTGPQLAPEIAATPRTVYSFQDVLALRAFVRQCEHASLEKIRGQSATSGTSVKWGTWRLTGSCPTGAATSSL
jgi:hypothetical protein